MTELVEGVHWSSEAHEPAPGPSYPTAVSAQSLAALGGMTAAQRSEAVALLARSGFDTASLELGAPAAEPAGPTAEQIAQLRQGLAKANLPQSTIDRLMDGTDTSVYAHLSLDAAVPSADRAADNHELRVTMAKLGIPPAGAKMVFDAVSRGMGETARLAGMTDEARSEHFLAQGKLLERTVGAEQAKAIGRDAEAFLNSLPPALLAKMNAGFVWRSAQALMIAANLYRSQKGRS